MSELPHSSKSVFSSKTVLLLGRLQEDCSAIEALLQQLKCRVLKIHATEQLNPKLVRHLRQNPPCLVLIASDDRRWAETVAQRLRHLAQQANLGQTQITFITCSDRATSPEFDYGEDSTVDGHVVTPLSRAVLGTLVQSAAVRQLYHSVTAV